MWFAVLGPMSIRHGDREIPVPAGKLRVLLAVLLVHANEVQSFDALGEAVWNGAPPPAARATIRNYVKRLRQVLGPEVGARIVTRDPGYLIELTDDELDVLRFTRLCQKGGAAIHAGAWQQASAVLDEAAGLCRGMPFIDVLSPVLQRDEVSRLEQLRLQMVEWRIDADLHLGRHAQVVPQLQAMAREHPLRESVHERLLLALAGCGRRAEALDAYQQARRTLVRELGIEPGPDLRQVHRRILTGDPTLSATPMAGRPTAQAQRTPKQGFDSARTAKRRWSRKDLGIVAVVASMGALVTAAGFAVVNTVTTGGPSALYDQCPVGDFCLFNGKNATTDYCTFITPNPTADHDCAWLRRGWKVRSVFNRTASTVEYCVQEQYQDCVGSTPPGGWGNLPATYTVRSVKAV